MTKRPLTMVGLLVLLFALLALLRPLDHDESQYVAAAALGARGWLPYRDYAYLQTPLQPLLFAPLAWLAGPWTWPALRLVNALLGVVAVAGVARAARIAGATPRAALIAAGLFACCDILLFSVGTARNDALPAALLAAALAPAMRGARGAATPASAMLAGLLLAAAAAAKISYAIPALAYGLYTLIDRRHRPGWVALGAAPVVALVGLLAALAPPAFLFEVFGFPAYAPTEYYLAQARGWKLSWAAKAIDSAKFLALGPGLVAGWLVARDRQRDPAARVLDVLAVAGLIAALLPAPTWRQYLLPLLVPMFARLALAWEKHPPRRAGYLAVAVFAAAGVIPSIISAGTALRGVPMADAMRQGAAIRVAMAQAGATGSVATLAPQFLPAADALPDPRLATGPFYFRSSALLDEAKERAFGLLSHARVPRDFRPAAILVGGEGGWTSGERALDGMLEHWAVAHRYRAVPVAGDRFRLYVRPR